MNINELTEKLKKRKNQSYTYCNLESWIKELNKSDTIIEKITYTNTISGYFTGLLEGKIITETELDDLMEDLKNMGVKSLR